MTKAKTMRVVQNKTKRPRPLLDEGVADRAVRGFLGGWVYGVRENVYSFQYLDGAVYGTVTFYIDKKHVRKMLRREKAAKKKKPKTKKGGK